MKLPKTFRPEKNLDKKLEYLIEKNANWYKLEQELKVVNEAVELYESYDLFLEESEGTSEEESKYHIAEEILKRDFHFSRYPSEKSIQRFINHTFRKKADKYSATVADLFSIEEDLGVYISALTNLVLKTDNDKLHLKLSKKLNHLGKWMNKGKLTIKGDVGDYLGNGMFGGEIIVYGNAGYIVGNYLENGRIRIRGNVGGEIGSNMKSGKILIGGDAGDYVGDEMEGGEIVINGNTEDLTGYCMRGGKIIVKGNTGGNVGHYMRGCKTKIYVYGERGCLGEGCTEIINKKSTVIVSK